jgi:vacuolar-type H+-ATPase subunit I/STV1
LKSEDPLPLRRSKITAEAKLKPVEKARKEAEAATAVVAEQTRKVEEAVRDTEEKVREAVAYLEHAKKQGTSPGALWWLDRELKEAQKYLPKSKQSKQ